MGNTIQSPKLDAKLYSVILEKCLAFLGLPNTYSLIGSTSCSNTYLSNDHLFTITTKKNDAFEATELMQSNDSLNVVSVKKINTDLTNESVYLIVMKFDINVHDELQIDEEIKDLEKAMRQNSTTIEDLAQKLSQRLGFTQATILGKGSQGFAVDVGRNTVMKITTDVSEVSEMTKLVGKRNKNLGDVYKVYRMNAPYDNTYVILRELLKVNPQENQRRFQLLTDVMYSYDVNIHDYVHSFDRIVAKGDRTKLMQYAEMIGQLPEEDFKVINDFFNIFDELISNGIKSGDFTPYNFGFKSNGNYAFYDLGYSDNDSVGDIETLSLNERVMSFMKNSSTVKVKKKCQINGNGDGTSTACNQGEIKNIELGRVDEGQNVKIEYGALMLMFDVKKWNEVTDIIEEDDVYDKPTFGKETDPHVTILYGFHKEVTVKDILDVFENKHKFTDDIEIELVGISHFETPKYDVVKFDVKSNKLVELNKLAKKLPFTSDYPDYHPHMTLSYVKKGTGKKYQKKFEEPIKLKSNKIVYSTVDDVKTTLHEHTSRWNKRLQKKQQMVTEDLKIGLNDLPFKAEVEQAGGKLYSVGGAVRDTILGKESKDLDILITGVPLDKLEQILSKYGKVDSVGKSFGIIKFNTPQTGEIDIAIPRTERKNDQGGYQGFDVTSDHNLPIEKDLERRDFTINAIAKDSSGLMIDPYGGQGDIEKKQIRMVNPQAFSDDPLRMLRAVQFAARFGFDIESNTMASIRQNAVKIKEISPERILIEFDKIVKKGNPMIGAKLLRQTGLYDQIFGTSRGVNLAEFKNVRTMGEFIFALTYNALQNPAEFYKTNMKGDLETYNEIRALQIGKTFNGDKKTIFDMYKVYPKAIDSKLMGQEFLNAVQYMRSKNIPFSLKEVPVNGNDLMQLGLQGKQIGDAFVDILNKIYKEELPNDREAILNYLGGSNGQ